MGKAGRAAAERAGQSGLPSHSTAGELGERSWAGCPSSIPISIVGNRGRIGQT